MSYTPIEAESIKANLAKIQEYVKEHFVPRLHKFDTLSVDFGEMKRYPNQWEMEHEHSFGFDWNGKIWYRCGGFCLRFVEANDCGSGNIFQSWPYAVDLLLHWQQVKQLIVRELDRRDCERAALSSFEV